MRLILFTALILLAGYRLSAQTILPGSIVFTDRDIPLQQVNAKANLQQYTLTNISKLFITAHLKHSLHYGLLKIVPTINIDSLSKMNFTKDAGYQFTIYVDHRKIYKSNIWTRIRPISDSTVVLAQSLMDYPHPATSWSQWFWVRFMHNGGQGALTEGAHQFRLEIRPYVRAGKDTLEGSLLAAGDLKVWVKLNVSVDPSKVSLTPLEAYDGFGLSKDGYDSAKIKQLKGLIDSGFFKQISSVVVIKNGNILIEEYFNGETRDTKHDPRSVGKSFASTLMGMAIRDGHLKSEEQPLSDFYSLSNYSNNSPEKEHVKIKDLLTMCSAFDGDDDDDSSPGNEENMYDKPNWVKWTLDLPLSSTRPRDRWHYFTAGAMLTGDILNSKVPGGLDAYSDLKLFSPLGISDYQWMFTPQHVANTAGGIQLKSLDFAKYGQLYKNNGQWMGQQLLPADWIKKTFTKYHELPDRPDEYYGYFFWNKKYRVGDKSYETWYCTGNGGNKIFIFTDQPLVVVVTATAYGQAYAHPQVDKMMTEYILPAVLER
jgi:CubicO group peptidase (beta-lactamase class C family)